MDHQSPDTEPRNRHERRSIEAGHRLAYSVNTLAEALGVGRTKLYSEIANGNIRAKKIGTRTIIPAQAAADYIDGLPDLAA